MKESIYIILATVAISCLGCRERRNESHEKPEVILELHPIGICFSFSKTRKKKMMNKNTGNYIIMSEKVIERPQKGFKFFVPYILYFVVILTISLCHHTNDLFLKMVQIFFPIYSLIIPLSASDYYKIVLSENRITAYCRRLLWNSSISLPYAQSELVYTTYVRKPRKTILIRNKECKRYVMVFSQSKWPKSLFPELIDEFSRHPDAKIIRVEMK